MGLNVAEQITTSQHIHCAVHECMLMFKSVHFKKISANDNTYATTYYKNSLKKTFTDAENIINSYNYDAGNRLSQISLPNEGSIIFNQYQWNSPAKITYPGGLTRTISYDLIMRTNSINNSDSAKNTLMNYAYAYDKVGNIKTKTTEHGNYVYGYDERYRLTTVDNPVVPSVTSLVDEAYTYDDAGNRLTDSSTTGNWNYNTTNQLTAYSDTTLVYDANGSTIKKTKAGVITTFDYNTENRLSTVKDGAGATVATYYYDPFGRRLYKDVAGTRTYFMYAAEGLIAELDSTGVVTQSYGYTPQSTYGTSPLYTKTSAGYAYYQLDHLGTPQQLVNKTGVVVWKAKALAFGESTVEVNTVANNFRFAGQYFDKETNLHYNYFRDYDPSTGRYVQSDLIGLGGGLNTYGYVFQSPIKGVDLYGLDVTISINRDTYTTTSITSTVSVTSDQVADYFSGYVLEDYYAGTWGQKLPIPPGTYEATIITRESGKRVVQLKGIVGYTYIQIHVGNTADDVEGCFVVGANRGQNWVGLGPPANSKTSLDKVLKIIDDDKTGNITVVVNGSNIGPTETIIDSLN